jgi:UPF0755 protein
MIRKLFLFLIVSCLLAASSLVWFAYTPLPRPAKPFEFNLKQGSSLKTMAHDMQQAGLLSQDWAFIWMVRGLGKSAQIQAGSYQIESQVTPLELLDILCKGQVIQRQISVIEGWTFSQFRAALNANPEIRHNSVNLTNAEILQRIGAAETHPEGLLFPDTYQFAPGNSDLHILQRAYKVMQKRLLQAWESRDQDLPLQTPYQALILASIVEKETGTESDRAMVAGVFVNRLRKGMMLQTDPTVIYGLGERFDGNLRRVDLQTDTVYNTYTRTGLPPTPIALPGKASLQAALHPAQTDALYFVARGDGSSQFSSNLVDHNRAVNKYQK